MRAEDFKALTVLGQALWSNPDDAEKRSVETVSAVSLLNLTGERGFERALLILFGRALQEGPSASAKAVHQPFFRLGPQERFALSLLHSGRISYQKLAELLGKSVEQIQMMAWSARVHLANSPGVVAPHPTGSSRLGASCPEYDFTRPWTQRFLDDEVDAREHLFLQNHMMGCKTCRESLNRCRHLYYAVDAMLPRSSEEKLEDQRSRLETIFRRSRIMSPAADFTMRDSLKIFLGRWDIRLVLGGAVAWVVFEIL